MNRRERLGRIAIAGAGVAGVLAALALRRALPQAEVLLLQAEPDPAALADRLPALFPSARAVLAERVGLDEEALVRAGLANRRFADSFADWEGDTWLRPFGEPAGAPGPGGFHQHWLDARRRGHETPYHSHFGAGRIALGTAGAEAPLAGTDYALRIDPAGFARWSARQMATARIAAPAAPLTGAEGGEQGIAAALLADGTTVGADLFVDCTGPAALLHGALDNGFEAWRAVGCDRVLLASGQSETTAVSDRYTALPVGWRAALPLPGGTTELFAWSSNHLAEGRARRLFGHGAAAEAVAIRPGRRSRPFLGNVVALGDTAAQPGPLAAAGLTLALGALDLLIELLPGRAVHDGERREYNRRAQLQAERLRDFVALPVVAGRVGGPFWQAARADLPAGLTALLAEFARRGSVARPEEDLLEPHDWLSALIGLGIVPEVPSPLTATADPVAVARAFGTR